MARVLVVLIHPRTPQDARRGSRRRQPPPQPPLSVNAANNAAHRVKDTGIERVKFYRWLTRPLTHGCVDVGRRCVHVDHFVKVYLLQKIFYKEDTYSNGLPNLERVLESG